jgi:hypothetical protein
LRDRWFESCFLQSRVGGELGYGNWLGLSAVEIEELRQSGII